MAITPLPGWQVDPNNPNGVIQSAPPEPTAAPVTVLSSQAGQQQIIKDQTTVAKLSPAPAAPTAPGTPVTTTTPAAPTSKVTLINPQTQQTVSFNDASINKDNITGYLNSGYSLESADGNLPSWLSSATTPQQPKSKDQMQLEQDKTELDAAKAKLTSFDTSNDPALKNILSSIGTQWDQRIADMERANKSREANLSTTGVRLGSQYSGGVFGSIISAEERDGVDRIANLESQKQQALIAAKQAYDNQEWSRYSDLVNMADKAYSSQLDTVTALNKATAEQNQKIQDATVASSRENAIVGLIAQGVTDPLKLFDFLNHDDTGKVTGDITTKEIDDVLGRVVPKASSSGVFKFGNAEAGKLLAAGLSGPDIQALQDDLNTGGEEAVLAGLSGAQKKVVQEVLQGTKAVSGTGNVITIAEAKSLGIPVSLVGRSQAQVIQDLSSNTPPAWFVEYIQNQKQENLLPSNLQKEWVNFKAGFNKTSSSSAAPTASSYGVNLPAPVE